jgi:hypothetical protein
VDVNAATSIAEMFYTAGTENTIIDFNPGEKDLSLGTAYLINNNHRFGLLSTIMNTNETNSVIYLIMTYEYLEGDLPPNWKAVKPVVFKGWLDQTEFFRPNML